MNVVPDVVLIRVLSRISRKSWTCGASSVPYVAVAIKQPFVGGGLSSVFITWQTPSTASVPGPHTGSVGSMGSMMSLPVGNTGGGGGGGGGAGGVLVGGTSGGVLVGGTTGGITEGGSSPPL